MWSRSETKSESMSVRCQFRTGFRGSRFLGHKEVARIACATVLAVAWSIAGIAAEAHGPAPNESAKATGNQNTDRKPNESEYRLNFGDVLEFSVRGFPD